MISNRIIPSDVSPKHPLRTSREASRSQREWLAQELYRFDHYNIWTVREAVEGTQIFGATGSGKTSGSGKAFATSLIRSGFGGLVLTAKSDDLQTWLGYFEAAGVDPRERLVVLSPDGPYHFNPLAYEYFLDFNGDRQGDTRRLVNLFMTALGSGQGEVSQTDPYWNDALRELLTHAAALASFANGCVEDGHFVAPSGEQGIRLADMAEIVRSAPQSRSELRSRTWKKSSVCSQLVSKADAIYKQLAETDPRREDVKGTVGYWLGSFPNLSDRTRSVIVSSFTSKANELLRQPLRTLFCTNTSPDVTPEETFRGKIVLLDFPVKTYGEAGRLAQVLYKTVWQHAAETPRRWLGGTAEWTPTFLWADEAQHFVTDEDVLFQATARSQLAATVYLTQNISNYYHALGGSRSSATDSLLGSLQMKVFHTNGDPATNEWAERLFGTDVFGHVTPSSNTSAGQASSFGLSHQQAREPILPASDFTKLQRGGSSDLQTEAVVFHAGRRWQGADGRRNFLFHRFKQR